MLINGEAVKWVVCFVFCFIIYHDYPEKIYKNLNLNYYHNKAHVFVI